MYGRSTSGAKSKRLEIAIRSFTAGVPQVLSVSQTTKRILETAFLCIGGPSGSRNNRSQLACLATGLTYFASEHADGPQYAESGSVASTFVVGFCLFVAGYFGTPLFRPLFMRLRTIF